jgi:membrane-associated phospholipid phosphatase
MAVSKTGGAVVEREPLQEGLFEPRPGGLAERVGDGLEDHHPAVAALAVTVAGWAVLSIVLVGIGLFLTDVLIGSSVNDSRLGMWDADVNRWLADHRTSFFNTLTAWGSRFADTFTIIIGTAVLALVFLVRRWWREALFIVLSPTIEVTVFLVVTFVVDRERPPVERLDTAPPTSSFPSGHVAASVAFYVALALIIDNRTRSALLQGLAWVLAIFAPLSVLLSRLYRGMHFPTDVLFGVLGGLASLAVALLAVRAATSVAQRRRPAPDAAVGALR